MLKKLVFVALALLCLTPFMPAWLALMLGISFALTLGNPFSQYTKSMSTKLLALSIIGLGAGLNFYNVLDIGLNGFLITAVSVIGTLAIGLALGAALKLPIHMNSLISFGTSICGGSAIAALSSVLKPKEHDISIALAVVFILNAIALLLFPLIGELLDLTQKQFGLWAAIAIHDTSSVVGASMQYGDEALEIATTTKLVRALWIIPLVLAWAFYLKKSQKEEGDQKIKMPWFIGGFVVMAALVTFIPSLQSIGENLAFFSKQLLVMTLFLIGAGVSKNALLELGVKPVIFATVLWGLVTVISLIWVIAYI